MTRHTRKIVTIKENQQKLEIRDLVPQRTTDKGITGAK